MPAPYEIPPLGTLEAFPKAVRMWEAVYTSARDRGFNKERSAKQAWGAVKNAGYYQDAAEIWRTPRSKKKNSLSPREQNRRLSAALRGVK